MNLVKTGDFNAKTLFIDLFFLFCLPYLSSTHEKANCIAILWAERPHSLGSCHLRCVWTTCLLFKSGGGPLSALPKNTTSELAGLFFTLLINAERQPEKLWTPFFKVFWFESTRGLNPRSTDCKVDALTTTPSCRFIIKY